MPVDQIIPQIVASVQPALGIVLFGPPDAKMPRGGPRSTALPSGLSSTALLNAAAVRGGLVYLL